LAETIIEQIQIVGGEYHIAGLEATMLMVGSEPFQGEKVQGVQQGTLPMTAEKAAAQ